MKLYAERFISGRMIHLDCDARMHVITMKTIENGGDFLPTDYTLRREKISGYHIWGDFGLCDIHLCLRLFLVISGYKM